VAAAPGVGDTKLVCTNESALNNAGKTSIAIVKD